MITNHLDESAYQNFRRFLEEQCGIVLGDKKQYLVKSRLTPLLSKFGMTSLSELITKTLSPRENVLKSVVIDAMTTNETLWFRDEYPFSLLKNKLLPEYKQKPAPVKIWSAASSSGQEPYSIAMTVAEYQQKNPQNIRNGVQIIGTDISKTMLEHCQYAHYDSLALSRGLSEERKRQFFEPGDNDLLKIKNNIQRMVSFRQLNLLTNYSLLGKFDIIFCRNVLIYFSTDLKKQIISQMYDALNDKGYLLLGASESLSGISQQFTMLRCNPGIIYQKKST